MTESTLGLHGLATTARVLADSEPLPLVLELAAEGARLTLNAASVSISRYDAENGLLRTIINVGDLAPGEQRWPQDETYAVTRWPRLAEHYVEVLVALVGGAIARALRENRDVARAERW